MNQITQFLISNGVLLLFAVAFAEQSGLPFPGSPWLMAAGALAASRKFSLIAAIGWAAAGCVAADAIWFFLGRRIKARVFRFFPHLQAVQIKLQRATLAKTVLHGTRMLTVAKFVPFGNLIPLHAGALEVGRLRFLLVDAFTSVVYAAVYAVLGFTFHNQLEQVVAFLRKLGAVSLLLIVVLAGTYLVHRFLKPGDAKHASRQSSTGIIRKGLTRAILRKMNGTLNWQRLLGRLNWPYVDEPLGPGRKVSAQNRGAVVPSLLAVSSAILANDKCPTKTNSIQE